MRDPLCIVTVERGGGLGIQTPKGAPPAVLLGLASAVLAHCVNRGVSLAEVLALVERGVEFTETELVRPPILIQGGGE